MRPWIFSEAGIRQDIADFSNGFILTDFSSEEPPMGFLYSPKLNLSQGREVGEFIKGKWASLREFCERQRYDYLAIYLRECFPVKDREIESLTLFLAARDSRHTQGMVFPYWPKK